MSAKIVAWTNWRRARGTAFLENRHFAQLAQNYALQVSEIVRTLARTRSSRITRLPAKDNTSIQRAAPHPQGPG
jgi:hypothetical protein